MGDSPLVSLILGTLLLTVSADLGQDCQVTCCPSGSFCCGSFCAPTGSREPVTCVQLPDGCCNNPANTCAPRTTSSPPASTANDAVTSDGAADGAVPPSRDTVASDAAGSFEAESGSATAAAGSPCRADCCVTEDFCCGNTCRPLYLEPSLTCPAIPICCSNPQRVCSDPDAAAATSPLAVVVAPSPSPTPAPAPGSIAADPPASVPPLASTAPSEAGTAGAESPEAAGAPSSAAGSASEICEDGCEAWWAQCEGASYVGPGCCTTGSSCRAKDAFFSQCVPDNASPLCSSLDGAGAYCQCGGATFLGPLECGPGLECIDLNPFYSQCRPQCSLRAQTLRVSRGSA